MGSLAWTDKELEAFKAIEEDAAEVLRRRKEAFGIPKIKFIPTGEEIIVHRLPARERKTKAGLYIPEFSMDHKYEIAGDIASLLRPNDNSRKANDVLTDMALLLDAGLGARDWLRAQCIFLGDFVRFGHYSGNEQDSQHFDPMDEDLEGNFKSVLQLNVKDIRGSRDLHWRLHGSKHKHEDTGEDIEVAPMLQIKWLTDGSGRGVHVIRPIVKE